MQKTKIEHTLSRRQALRGLGVAAGLLIAVHGRRAGAQGSTPHLDVKDPSAVKVGYVEDATKVDARKYPAYSKGSSCENCLQLQGAAGAPYRPCTLFPGKLVATAGWCSAWTPEI